jgi:hypothetical protein
MVLLLWSASIAIRKPSGGTYFTLGGVPEYYSVSHLDVHWRPPGRHVLRCCLPPVVLDFLAFSFVFVTRTLSDRPFPRRTARFLANLQRKVPPGGGWNASFQCGEHSCGIRKLA